MGCAPIAHVLWSKIMRYDTAEPKWLNRDRFVLSNGHSCALLYSMLHLTGYDLPMSELQRFRKIDAITAGHPENILVSRYSFTLFTFTLIKCLCSSFSNLFISFFSFFATSTLPLRSLRVLLARESPTLLAWHLQRPTLLQSSTRQERRQWLTTLFMFYAVMGASRRAFQVKPLLLLVTWDLEN